MELYLSNDDSAVNYHSIDHLNLSLPLDEDSEDDAEDIARVSHNFNSIERISFEQCFFNL